MLFFIIVRKDLSVRWLYAVFEYRIEIIMVAFVRICSKPYKSMYTIFYRSPERYIRTNRRQVILS